MEQFMMAFDTDLPPIVGQQISRSRAPARRGRNADRPDDCARRGDECELVVKGNLGGVQRDGSEANRTFQRATGRATRR